MHLIGRWARVRQLGGPGRLSAPYMLDRKWGRLLPAAGEEWWQSPEGLWCPVLSGGAGFSGRRQPVRAALGQSGLSGSTTTTALSSNYVAGTGGTAYATRVIWPTTLTLTDLYFFISSYTGTAASVNDLNWEVRTGTNTNPTTTAPGLLASGTIDPASATGWIHISGISQVLTGGTLYWLIVGDADGNGTDCANLLRSHASAPSSSVNSYVDMPAAATTNGFTTTTTPDLARACMVLVFSDGSVWGNPWTAIANHAANTNRAGWYLSTGVTEQLTVFGMVSGTDTFSGLQVYDGSTIPGGSTLASSTIILYSGSGNIVGYQLAAPFTMAKATPYRWVYTYASNSGGQPREMQIGTGADANLKAAMLGGAGWYYALANGTTNWANDVVTSQPGLALLIEDQVAIGSGGMIMSRVRTGY